MIPMLKEHRVEVDELCRRFGVRRLEVFGSAATGEFRAEESDLDFLVEFADKNVGYFGSFFDLKESLEALFGRPVDLLFAQEFKNPYFKRSVDQTKMLLYGPPQERAKGTLEANEVASPQPKTQLSEARSPYGSVPKKYLFDIFDAAESLTAFTAGKTFEDYQRDLMLRSAVERQFEIIGEAIAQLAHVDESVARRITDYQQVIAFRNIRIHGYATLDDEQIWNVIQRDLPRLRIEVSVLLPDDSAHG
jgi:uncharacterized protein with HEPN domain/predicted nucleotidyltransferase